MNLNPQLDQLENAQLVRRLDEADLAYLFRHTLTQERAYQSLLVKTRRNLHASVARACEELYSDRLDEFAALLAHHYAEAGDDAKTLEYATRAGDVAARVYANAEAVVFYTQAIVVGAKHSSEVRSNALPLRDLYLKRGRLFETSGQYEQALTNYAEMETLAREWSNRQMELAALIARATIHSIPSKFFDIAKAQALSDQALAFARELHDEAAEAKILWNLMLLNSRADVRYRQAIQYGEGSLAIARRLGLREQLAFTLNDLGPLYPLVGESERALELGAEARAMWREMNNLPMLADNLNYAAMTHLGRGEIEQAVAVSEEARRISQMTGNQWGEAFSLTWIGAGYLELGRPDQAIAAMEDALRLGEVFPPTLAVTRATLARLYADLGAREHALELARPALSHAEDKFPVFVPWAAGAFVHACIIAGDLPQADATLKRLPLTPDKVNPRFDVALQLAAVELALAKAEYEAAVSLCDTILAKQRATRLRQYLATALLLKGQGLRGLRQLDEAFVILCEARGEAEATHALWSLWQILAASSQVEFARGNVADATRLRGEARGLIESIAADTPPDLRDSFLAASLARLS